MRTGMLALATGLLTLRFLPQLPPGWLLWPMPLLALMLLPFRSYPLAFWLLGFSWACISAQWALNDRLSLELDGQTRWLEGRVSGLPQQVDGVVRFELEEARSRRGRLPQRLRLAWYGGPPIHAGQRWRLAVKLKRPVGCSMCKALTMRRGCLPSASVPPARSRTASYCAPPARPGVMTCAGVCWKSMPKVAKAAWWPWCWATDQV